jgi:hypothetical protein
MSTANPEAASPCRARVSRHPLRPVGLVYAVQLGQHFKMSDRSEVWTMVKKPSMRAPNIEVLFGDPPAEHRRSTPLSENVTGRQIR